MRALISAADFGGRLANWEDCCRDPLNPSRAADMRPTKTVKIKMKFIVFQLEVLKLTTLYKGLIMPQYSEILMQNRITNFQKNSHVFSYKKIQFDIEIVDVSHH